MMVFGTRPEAIKMAPLYKALLSSSDEFEVVACITAQHRQMLDQVLAVFDIKPDIDLDLMREGQDLIGVTAAVLTAMRSVLDKERPDIVLVHGDTATTLAVSMACFYKGIRVGHVEAGLRTYNIQSPFPEEFNRQIVSKIACVHFVPTQLSMENLLSENVDAASITVTGNTVIDALNWILERIDLDASRKARVANQLSSVLPFDWTSTKFVLITGHRRENFGDGFVAICEAISDLANKYPDVHFVYPVHLNPNVQNPVNATLGALENVHLVDPLEYESFTYLLKSSHIVLTDSGGIQEEAPSLGKPVLVMRDITERPEAVTAGTVRLVGADRNRIVSNVSELLDDETSYRAMARAHNPYGDGHACARIIETLRTMP
jgi:UDP-N-acetylglucosamine 2-epimerase (non-hydrolysing)